MEEADEEKDGRELRMKIESKFRHFSFFVHTELALTGVASAATINPKSSESVIVIKALADGSLLFVRALWRTSRARSRERGIPRQKVLD